MKKILAVLLILGGLAAQGYCYTEVNDVFISTESCSVISVSSTAWTIGFSSWTDVRISTDVTGIVNRSYTLMYYTVRNNATSDIDVKYTNDDTKDESDCMNILKDEVFVFVNKFQTRYFRLPAGTSGTANVIIEKNYIRR